MLTVKSINTYCVDIKTWGLAGVTTSNVRYNTPQTILSKFKTPYFFHTLLRCCLCNSVFISAKVFSGQRLNFSAILNLLYHLLFFNLCHAFCIVMVVQYVGAIELVVGGYIQHEQVTRIEEGVLRPS